MKIALLCGGPSAERGISLNSARSVLDHLSSREIEILPVYFDLKKQAYAISPAQLYSNTPSDFDFKLQETARKLSEKELIKFLKTVDLTFPVMHGPFGEDGGIQKMLEAQRIPFIGAPAAACKQAFDKYSANEFIRQNGFFTLPSIVLKIYQRNHAALLRSFFQKHKIRRAIVKPATGGSSIGVFSVDTPEKALEKAAFLFSKRIDTRVVIEPFCTGIEFTVIILQNRFGMPVAVLPTEIEADYTDHQIFDYRKKYLPTRQVKYHCPPRFSNADIERIQVQAEQLFTVFGMRDFARFDGWLLPDGNIWFSDFNPLSGMEQNSFLFQQGARLGFSHAEMLRYIVRNACRRYDISFAEETSRSVRSKQKIAVLCGGKTSERQVSLMSGTNVWLKLRQSEKYAPELFLWDLQGRVWPVPYALALNHTVEEVQENCLHAEQDQERLSFLQEKARLRLALEKGEAETPFFLPKSESLQSFIRHSSYIFLALHGGAGENGTLQKILEQAKMPFNGSDSAASRLCMDKYRTGAALRELETKGIFTAPKETFVIKNLAHLPLPAYEKLWQELRTNLGGRSFIVKPRAEGCSSGIVHLFSAEDLKKYVTFLTKKIQQIPPRTFTGQDNIVEMPLEHIENILIERFITTDRINIRAQKLRWQKVSGWIEVTTAIFEKNGNYHSLNPSLTVAQGSVLSVEEKFQGGTGVNITPPPPEIISTRLLTQIKKRFEIVAKTLGLKNYARIDAFLEIATGNIMVIEVNTLPALTPSTVLFHQGLAEKPNLFPRAVLEKIIATSMV